MIVLIWSFEHNAWWGPGERGYVAAVEEAGRYTLSRAEAICLRANIVAINEAIVPLPAIRNSDAQRPAGVEEGRR
jgi:hypothetical protein